MPPGCGEGSWLAAAQPGSALVDLRPLSPNFPPSRSPRPGVSLLSASFFSHHPSAPGQPSALMGLNRNPLGPALDGPPRDGSPWLRSNAGLQGKKGSSSRPPPAQAGRRCPKIKNRKVLLNSSENPQHRLGSHKDERREGPARASCAPLPSRLLDATKADLVTRRNGLDGSCFVGADAKYSQGRFGFLGSGA